MRTLLFIDDHASILQMLKRRFEKLDYKVFTAINIREATVVLAKEPVDLIVVDYMMPDASGLDFIQSHKELDIPIMMMTAHSSISLAIEFLKNGGTDYVEKPIDVEILNIKIDRAIKQNDLLKSQKAARQKAEDELRITNKSLLIKAHNLELANKHLNTFASSISHDLRAPLRQILSFIGLLKRKNIDVLDSSSKEYFDFIAQAAMKMENLIEGLLAFSKNSGKELNVELISLKPFLEQIVGQMTIDNTSSLQFEWGTLPGSVYADKLLLEQVFINLIGNAIKYSSKRSQPIIKIDSLEEAERFIISIADNGVGFDMKYADKLFTIFNRLHSENEFEGTGIGLAFVKNIIEKHHGDIWTKAKIDEGATFYFSLPKRSILLTPNDEPTLN